MQWLGATFLGLLLVAFILASIAFHRKWRYHEREYRRIRTERVSGRPDLNVDTIYTAYFASSGFQLAAFERAWLELAADLEVPPTKMRPDDVFLLHYAVDAQSIVPDPIDEVDFRIIECCKRIGRDPQTIRTVNDYVRLIAPTYERGTGRDRVDA